MVAAGPYTGPCRCCPTAPSKPVENPIGAGPGRYPDRTTGSVESISRERHDPGMKKRVFAAFLWFYTGWYAGALMADFLALSPYLGPIIGTASAALFVGDPRRIIWTARAMAPKASEAAAEPA